MAIFGSIGGFLRGILRYNVGKLLWGMCNMYCKRVLILQQTKDIFTESGKQLCGMVKLVNCADKTNVTVFVTNVASSCQAEWWIMLNFGGKCISRKLTTLANETFSLKHHSLEQVACLLVAQNDKCTEVARAHLGDAILCDMLARQVSSLVNQGMTEYEQFVSATSNFYPNFTLDIDALQKTSSQRYKVVEEYSNAFERFYASGGSANYYQSVKEEIVKVFVQFPPYYPLINKYKNCFFVRVDFPNSERYFVMGVLQKQGAIKYICYGLPAERKGIADKDFVLVENSPTSFYMLFQDANTGQITTLNDV